MNFQFYLSSNSLTFYQSIYQYFLLFRIKEEWDLALTNILTTTACNAFVVWLLAPCRSYGNTFQFDLENTIQKLPNNIFEKNYPMREFDLQKRIQSFLYKTVQLGVVGTVAGCVQGLLSNLLSSKKEGRLVNFVRLYFFFLFYFS
jgi:Protein RETICULATA-related